MERLTKERRAQLLEEERQRRDLPEVPVKVVCGCCAIHARDACREKSKEDSCE